MAKPCGFAIIFNVCTNHFFIQKSFGLYGIGVCAWNLTTTSRGANVVLCFVVTHQELHPQKCMS